MKQLPLDVVQFAGGAMLVIGVGVYTNSKEILTVGAAGLAVVALVAALHRRSPQGGSHDGEGN